MDTLQVLKDARAAQAKHGHGKHITFSRYTEHVCMQGALIIAMTGRTREDLLEDPEIVPLSKFQDAAEALGFQDIIEVCEWNNRDDVGEGDVLVKFDEAIERLESELQAEMVS